MPNNRVLDDIKRSTILITPQQKALIECAGIDPEDIYEFMENGDVDFTTENSSDAQEIENTDEILDDDPVLCYHPPNN